MAPLLRRLKTLVSKKPPEPALLEIDGRPVRLTFRRNRRARRLIIRLARDGASFTVTLPPRASRAEAIDFAERSAHWITDRLSASPAHVAFENGASVPLRGVAHRIVHRPDRRGTVWVDAADGSICVAGEPAHLARRLRDWLRQQAKRDLAEASERYARAMEVTVRRITIRDQSSRWGSCSADGHLSYSWRLILAPSFVLDYVAAHEVAHLRHMDHGPRFWRLALTHCARAKEAQRWLRAHGNTLHRYGR